MPVRQKSKLKPVRPPAFLYWVEIRYRNASTNWQWVSKWVRKSRRSYLRRWPRKLSHERKCVIRSWFLMQVYIEEELQQKVSEYLHFWPTADTYIAYARILRLSWLETLDFLDWYVQVESTDAGLCVPLSLWQEYSTQARHWPEWYSHLWQMPLCIMWHIQWWAWVPCSYSQASCPC